MNSALLRRLRLHRAQIGGQQRVGALAVLIAKRRELLRRLVKPALVLQVADALDPLLDAARGSFLRLGFVGRRDFRHRDPTPHLRFFARGWGGTRDLRRWGSRRSIRRGFAFLRVGFASGLGRGGGREWLAAWRRDVRRYRGG